MKRYLLSIAAAVIAIGAVAFKVENSESKNQTDYDFFYKLGTYAQPDVQTNSNWEMVSKPCPAGNAKACKINVPASYTHLDGSGNRVLNTSEASNNVVIDAVIGSGSNYVPQVSTSTGLNTRQIRS